MAINIVSVQCNGGVRIRQLRQRQKEKRRLTQDLLY